MGEGGVDLPSSILRGSPTHITSDSSIPPLLTVQGGNFRFMIFFFIGVYLAM